MFIDGIPAGPGGHFPQPGLARLDLNGRGQRQIWTWGGGHGVQGQGGGSRNVSGEIISSFFRMLSIALVSCKCVVIDADAALPDSVHSYCSSSSSRICCCCCCCCCYCVCCCCCHSLCCCCCCFALLLLLLLLILLLFFLVLQLLTLLSPSFATSLFSCFPNFNNSSKQRRLFSSHGYDAFVSEKISVNRSVRDIRHPL